jgi:hypothetical protein
LQEMGELASVRFSTSSESTGSHTSHNSHISQSSHLSENSHQTELFWKRILLSRIRG